MCVSPFNHQTEPRTLTEDASGVASISPFLHKRRLGVDGFGRRLCLTPAFTLPGVGLGRPPPPRWCLGAFRMTMQPIVWKRTSGGHGSGCHSLRSPNRLFILDKGNSVVPSEEKPGRVRGAGGVKWRE